MDLQLEDRVALIIGGGRGIGRAIAHSLSREPPRLGAQASQNVFVAQLELWERHPSAKHRDTFNWAKKRA